RRRRSTTAPTPSPPIFSATSARASLLSAARWDSRFYLASQIDGYLSSSSLRCATTWSSKLRPRWIRRPDSGRAPIPGRTLPKQGLGAGWGFPPFACAFGGLSGGDWLAKGNTAADQAISGRCLTRSFPSADFLCQCRVQIVSQLRRER